MQVLALGRASRRLAGRVFYRRDDLDAWLSSFATVSSTAQARAKKLA
jgi:hypothetical protein